MANGAATPGSIAQAVKALTDGQDASQLASFAWNVLAAATTLIDPIGKSAVTGGVGAAAGLFTSYTDIRRELETKGKISDATLYGAGSALIGAAGAVASATAVAGLTPAVGTLVAVALVAASAGLGAYAVMNMADNAASYQTWDYYANDLFPQLSSFMNETLPIASGQLYGELAQPAWSAS